MIVNVSPMWKQAPSQFSSSLQICAYIYIMVLQSHCSLKWDYSTIVSPWWCPPWSCGPLLDLYPSHCSAPVDHSHRCASNGPELLSSDHFSKLCQTKLNRGSQRPPQILQVQHWEVLEDLHILVATWGDLLPGDPHTDTTASLFVKLIFWHSGMTLPHRIREVI